MKYENKVNKNSSSWSSASILLKVGPAVDQRSKPDSERPVTGWDPETGRGERTTGAGGGKDCEQPFSFLKSGWLWFGAVLEVKLSIDFMHTNSCHPFLSLPPQHRRQQQELLKLQQQQALQLAQQPQAKLSGWGSVAKQPAATKSLLEIQREEAQQMKQRKDHQPPQQHPTVTNQIRSQTRTVRDLCDTASYRVKRGWKPSFRHQLGL